MESAGPCRTLQRYAIIPKRGVKCNHWCIQVDATNVIVSDEASLALDPDCGGARTLPDVYVLTGAAEECYRAQGAHSQVTGAAVSVKQCFLSPLQAFYSGGWT